MLAAKTSAMFVTHLECSLTGERYDAGKLQGLSTAGKPLLVRYNLDELRAKLTRETFASRDPTITLPSPPSTPSEL